MANAIRQRMGAWANIPITLAPGGVGIAAGAGRSSDPIANPDSNGRAKILLSLRMQTAPTADTILELFLLEQDDSGAITGRTDQWTNLDAAFTVINAKNLGVLALTASAAINFVDVFETTFVATLNTNGWGIAIRNGANTSMSNTEANQLHRFQYFFDEIQ